jgi:hypothetical protein
MRQYDSHLDCRAATPGDGPDHGATAMLPCGAQAGRPPCCDRRAGGQPSGCNDRRIACLAAGDTQDLCKHRPDEQDAGRACLTVKKVSPRRRAGAQGCCQGARRMARAAVEADPVEARFHRRNLGKDQHDTALWSGQMRPSPGRCRAAWALENHNLRRCIALRQLDRAAGHRWRDQRRTLPGLRRAGAGADAEAGRYRHHGQSAGP